MKIIITASTYLKPQALPARSPKREELIWKGEDTWPVSLMVLSILSLNLVSCAMKENRPASTLFTPSLNS